MQTLQKEPVEGQTPSVDVTKLLANGAIVAALVGIAGCLYTIFTGKHLTNDQTEALTQIIPLLGLVLAGFGIHRAKKASFRSTAAVAEVLENHLEKQGEVGAAGDVREAVGKIR